MRRWPPPRSVQYLISKTFPAVAHHSLQSISCIPPTFCCGGRGRAGVGETVTQVKWNNWSWWIASLEMKASDSSVIWWKLNMTFWLILKTLLRAWLPTFSMQSFLRNLPTFCSYYDVAWLFVCWVIRLLASYIFGGAGPGDHIIDPPPSTTPCELWLDVCVIHQRTTFQSSQASDLLSFVAEEPHCL